MFEADNFSLQLSSFVNPFGGLFLHILWFYEHSRHVIPPPVNISWDLFDRLAFFPATRSLTKDSATSQEGLKKSLRYAFLAPLYLFSPVFWPMVLPPQPCPTLPGGAFWVVVRLHDCPTVCELPVLSSQFTSNCVASSPYYRSTDFVFTMERSFSPRSLTFVVTGERESADSAQESSSNRWWASPLKQRLARKYASQFEFGLRFNSCDISSGSFSTTSPSAWPGVYCATMGFTTPFYGLTCGSSPCLVGSLPSVRLISDHLSIVLAEKDLAHFLPH